MPLNFDTADAVRVLAFLHRLFISLMFLSIKADYLSQSNLGGGFGFHPLSIVYSLPKALLGWSAIFVVIQTTLAAYAAVSRSTDFYFQAFIGALVVIAALVVVGVIGVMRRSFAAPSYQNGESGWINTILELFSIRSSSTSDKMNEENSLFV